MKIRGYTIPDKVILKVYARMKKEPFKAADLTKVGIDELRHFNLPYNVYASEVAMRIGDRLIQKERHAKNIEMISYPIWKWIGA